MVKQLNMYLPVGPFYPCSANGCKCGGQVQIRWYKGRKTPMHIR